MNLRAPLEEIPLTPLNTPRGRRAWRIPANAETSGLRYLAWGRRRFGDDPIPVARQVGFVYMLILRGNPKLCFKNGSFRCQPRTFFILHPSRLMGWRDESGSEQQILCWVWKKPPSLDLLTPRDGQWLHWRLNEDTISRLLLIHRATRSELSRSDAFSALAIRTKQTELDIELARSISRASDPEEARLPGELWMAVDWIEKNLNSARPVADLCDRLEIGKAQIVRLFKQYFNQTPLEFINRQKVRFATRRLLSGQPVKAVAIDLGYLHVHDFSRFYRTRTGQRPGSVGR